MANEKRPGQKIKMTSIDELLCVPEVEGTVDIDIRAIYPFENHPFKVLDDAKMDELVDSIKANGVLTPVIVRPDDEGTYEMISGHRRLHAAGRAGLTKIPAIVKEMTNDDAIIAMVDSNLQREEILPSEKAFSYKMKLEAMKRKAGRPDKGNYSQVGNNLLTKTSSEELSKQVGESRNQIFRFVRLTELIPELLDLVDEKRVPFVSGYEMSYFTRQIQKWLYEYIRENGVPKWDQINELRINTNQAELTQQQMIEYLNGLRPIPKESSKITFTERKLSKYFPPYYSRREREAIILELLEKWKAEQESQEE
ncbi:MAG: ParB/RepB/Spo0J family partition protein [Lachnospiraceae bacterium]|nr:ParB/RepB/Spo0J family partition protein [Lachnospiraceae bacterium]